MKLTQTSALLMALAILATPDVGDAQSRPTASRDPIGFTADEGEYVGETAVLRGNAQITQGRNRFRADLIRGVNLSGDSRMEASGNVFFVTPNETIRGDRATYDTAAEMIVVTGDVILTQGQNVLTGSRLTYNIRTEQAQIQGGQGGRIRGVFYPGAQ